MRIILGLLLVLSTAGRAQPPLMAAYCPLGCPASPPQNVLVFHHLYALSNNSKTKFADWVAYEVDVANFGESPGRDWSSDPLLSPADTLEEADYKDASKMPLDADRGHQAPLASFAGSRYWYELNYLSNITPQDKDLNQGAWKALEDAERAAVSYRNPLFVITGPLYHQPQPPLPFADEPHQVPAAYYKLIYDQSGTAVAFYMPQTTARQTDFCSTSLPLSELQQKLSYTLPRLTAGPALFRRLGCR